MSEVFGRLLRLGLTAGCPLATALPALVLVSSLIAVSGYVQRFPDPDDPAGYLRRGPEGEIPFTALPDGTGRTRTWTLTAGIAVLVRESVHLDLSYRHTDMGKIETDAVDVTIVRYRADGSRREIMVPINATAVDHRTHTLAMGLRFDL